MCHEVLLRRYRRLRVLCILLALAAAGLFALNYNSMVFRLLIGANYAHSEALDSLFGRLLQPGSEAGQGWDSRSNQMRYFDFAVMSAFTQALREESGDVYTHLHMPGQYRRIRDIIAADGARAEIRSLDERTVYLYLPNISGVTRRFVVDNIALLSQYERLVLDLRGNYGGELANAYRIADLFLDNGSIIALERGRMAALNRDIMARAPRLLDFSEVVILQDSRTASAAESLIQALYYNIEVIIAGEKSFGKGTAQVVLPLQHGYSIQATVLRLYGPSGRSINGVGIPPDMPLDAEKLPYYVKNVI